MFGVNVSKGEKCTLSGASGKFRRLLASPQSLIYGEGDVAFGVPKQTDAYDYSSTQLPS